MEKISRKACEKIWREYEPAIKKLSYVRLRGLENEIDDVVSEVFLALCEKFERDGSPDNPKAWMYSTFNNIINQRFRNVCKSRENISPIPMEEVELKFTHSIPDSAFTSVSTDEFYSIIKGLLTEEEFNLIEELYVNETKTSELAARFHITEGAVRQRGYRICAKLRTALSEYSDLAHLLQTPQV